MSTLVIIILILVLLGGGGFWYGRGAGWDNRGLGGILVAVLVIILICWLLGIR